MTTGPGAARARLETAGGPVSYYRLAQLDGIDRLPITVKVFLENLLRNAGNGVVQDSEIQALKNWKPAGGVEGEFPFYPARVLMQDFTGVPAAVDLAAMRSAMARLG